MIKVFLLDFLFTCVLARVNSSHREVYDFFLSSYSDYSRLDIILEFLAFWFGIISVVFAKKQNILVYPTGIICTIITMYLMYKVSLLGHILVNLLYTIISFFGWWNWSRRENNDLVVKVSKFTSNDLNKSLLIFFNLDVTEAFTGFVV